jgi:hypothetical protein
MPDEEVSTVSEFLEVRRVYVDSADRSKGTTSDYEFKLPRAIANVVSIELTGFAIPDSLTPSFQTGVNDAVDFSVTRGILTKFFTFRWPSNSYVYTTDTVSRTQSFCIVFEELLNRAMFSDPDFGAGAAQPVQIACIFSNFKTHLVNYTDSFTEFSLLVGSGPNREQAANLQLGFAHIDYHSTGQELISPDPVFLDPVKTIELFIDEIPEYSPLAVIYTSNEKYYRSKNEVSFRSRFLDESPPRILSRLTIRVRVNGRPIETGLKNEHSFSFTLYCITEESVPSWFTQYIAI